MAARKSLRQHVVGYAMPISLRVVSKVVRVTLLQLTADQAVRFARKAASLKKNPERVAMVSLLRLIHMSGEDRSHLVCHLVGKTISHVPDMAAKVRDIYPAARPEWLRHDLPRNALMVRTRLRRQ
jgi:hypothetical protein